ncbi:MAG: aminodeoxychorismate synthase, component I [Thermacetogeniaceae bacterium]
MIIREGVCPDPVRLFELIQGQPYSFFLDSGMDPGRLGRYSVISSDPFLVFKSKGDLVSVWQDGAWTEWRANPFDVLQDLYGRYRIAADPVVPVAAGAFGYFAYDLGWQLERLPQQAEDDLQIPDCYLGFYDRLVIFDHLEGKTYLTSTGLPESGPAAEARAAERLAELEALVGLAGRLPPVDDLPDPAMDAKSEDFLITGHFNRAAYRQAVQQSKDYIAAGDIFQVNLSQRFACPLPVTPWQLYRRLRRINPAPFAAYLSYPELVVASASPERFLQVRGEQVETRPIKGTRRRGRNPLEDARLSQELVNSDKDRAELVMIIDLQRNDLGRVCRFGSVHVPELIRLEEYPTVWHLVSTVRGALAEGRDVSDLLRASFPGGSITGAPKIRAMEIIEELEPVKRGVYTGSIGYLGFDGRCDLNIVIRTFVIKDQVAYFSAGGGIVADSDPDAEYWETIYKAQALMQALGYDEDVITTCLA